MVGNPWKRISVVSHMGKSLDGAPTSIARAWLTCSCMRFMVPTRMGKDLNEVGPTEGVSSDKLIMDVRNVKDARHLTKGLLSYDQQ